MTKALIGFSGYVGSTLLRQTHFEWCFRSANIQEIRGQTFELVVCAGAPAQKWIANREPETDRLKIEGLIDHLKTVKCQTFILISTVDVFKNPISVDENTPIVENGLHPYGLHRHYLEKFVQDYFTNHLIVRLPGLVGPGLRKNVIFDFLNDNNLQAIESRGLFQFYPMANLWYDLQIALENNLHLLHLTAEPVSVTDVSRLGFGKPFTQQLGDTPARYDMRSCYAQLFGGQGDYQYSVRETLQAIRSYAQSEAMTLKSAPGTSL